VESDAGIAIALHALGQRAFHLAHLSTFPFPSVRFFAEYLTGELTPGRFLVLHAALETDTLAARPVGAQLCVFAAHLACVWIFNDKSQAAHWRSPFALSISLIVAFIVSPLLLQIRSAPLGREPVVGFREMALRRHRRWRCAWAARIQIELDSQGTEQPGWRVPLVILVTHPGGIEKGGSLHE